MRALLGIGQAQQVAFFRAPACLFCAMDCGTRVPRNGVVVTAGALQIALHLFDAGAVVARSNGTLQPLAGFGVVLALRIGRGKLLGNLPLLCATHFGMNGFQRLDGRARLTRTLRGSGFHAVNGECFSRCAATHGFGFTHLAKRFFGFTSAQQITGLFEWIAHLRAHTLGAHV